MDRRQFLRCAAGAFTVSSLASALSACNTSLSGYSEPSNDGVGTYKFPQGLCCGDPGPTSGVFWTRVVRTDGVEGDIPVTLEISLTPMSTSSTTGFRLFKQIALLAKPQNDYIIHHKLTDLEPDTSYFYRFVAGGDSNNPTGRFRTLPAESAEVTGTQFVVLNGLDWSYNHWKAMTEQALRSSGQTAETYYMLLLGGSINAMVPDPAIPRTVEAEHQNLQLPDGLPVAGYGTAARTVADYTYLQQVYRSDERLQKLLSNYALMPMFAEQEFTNDGWQAHETYTSANIEQRDRLLAAMAAWMKFMPLDWGDVAYDSTATDFSRFRLYRSFRFGSLVDLILTEQRLQRSDHAIPENIAHGPLGLTGGIGSRLLADPVELATHSNNGQKILGDEQLAWTKGQLARPGVVWKLLAGESSLVNLTIDLGSVPDLDPALRKTSVINADSWGGYAGQQADLLDFVQHSGIANLVSLAAGGFFSASEIWPDYSGLRQPVMLECTTAPLSGRTLSEDISDQLAKEADPRFTSLRGMFGQSFKIDQKLLDQLKGWVRHVNTGSRGYSMVYVRTGEMVVDLIRVAESAASGQVTGSLITGRTRATIKAGKMEMVITEFNV